MADRKDSVLALTSNTRITLGLLATLTGAVAWAFGLAARIEATEYRLNQAESAHAELQQRILQSLHEQSDQLTSLGLDVATIQARISLLIEWSDMKRKRPNDRP